MLLEAGGHVGLVEAVGKAGSQAAVAAVRVQDQSDVGLVVLVERALLVGRVGAWLGQAEV